jgi:hypothetical protein
MDENRERRTPWKMKLLKDKIYEIAQKNHPMTVRQVFYQLVAQGVIEKTEKEYDNAAVNPIGDMREAGQLPWEWVIDGTRWRRQPVTYPSPQEALRELARDYRKDLWANQKVHVELWLEKAALAGVFYSVTKELDVALMVGIGFSSKGFLHDAAKDMESLGKKSYVYVFGDHDPSGHRIGENVENKLHLYAPRLDFVVERVAITEEQIARYKLPERPTKVKITARTGKVMLNPHLKDRQGKKFQGTSTELDAMPIDILQTLVRKVIKRHIDKQQWEKDLEQQEVERKALVKA